MQSLSRRTARLGVLVTLGILFGYIESLISIPIRIPGIKIGISNIVSVVSLYLLGPIDALVVSILRVLLSGILFGSGFSILYSISGAIISFLLMLLAYKLDIFSVIGVSVIGGVAHNIGQLLIACIVVKLPAIMGYTPWLIIFGVVAGLIVGAVSNIIINRLRTYVNKRGYNR